MTKKSNLLLWFALVCLTLIGISGCSNSNEEPTGNLSDDRAIKDDSVPKMLPPFGEPDKSPMPLEKPVELKQGEIVTFYTHKDSGKFVTKDEVIAGFEGLTPPWDDHTLTLEEFRSQYGDDIELISNSPWEGFTVYDPYELTLDELVEMGKIEPELAALITPGMTMSEFEKVRRDYNRSKGGGGKESVKK